MTILTHQRFDVLDSWRGLSAVMVVLFHFYAFSHVHDLPLVKHGYLFVDLFFVLSGFVIAHGYLVRLQNGYPMGKFVWLRFMRVYPLHAFMLFAYLFLVLAQGFLTQKPPFADPDFSLEGLLASFALAHSFGLIDQLVWNRPSWSISGEFISYLIFAAIAVLYRKNIVILSFLLMLSAGIWLFCLGHLDMDITYDGGLLRCLYGFFMGVLVYHIFNRYQHTSCFSNRKKATMMEGGAIVLVIIFVWFCGDNQFSFLSPFIFSVCLLVFAHESGAFSDWLKHASFLALGRLSYSIYMVHMLVQTLFYKAWPMVETWAGIPLRQTLSDGADYARIGLERWHGDILTLCMLIAVLIVSAATYRFIERPFYDHARRV